jgi:ABC-type phosphate transport system substrate-binding protein
LFDTQAIKKEFEKMHIDIQKDSATFVNDVKNTENKISYLPHKQGLERFIKNRKKLYGNK